MLLLLALGCATPPESPDAPYDETAMMADVTYLASPELDGRAPGSAGDSSARAMVSERFAALGLIEPEEFGDYEQPFTDAQGNETANVIGYLPGTDDALASDLVVVSAHLDHFGDGLLGANDNASGVSGLLSIAQALAEQGAARTVVFAAFGAEESGFEGSNHFYTDPPSDLDPADFVYNVNLDMIGSYDSTSTVFALGTMSGTPARAAVDEITAEYPHLDVGVGEASDESDNFEFCSRGVPYVFMWTEDLDCYHETCDTADRIDSENMALIAKFTGDLVTVLADTSDDLRAGVQAGTDVCGM